MKAQNPKSYFNAVLILSLMIFILPLTAFSERLKAEWLTTDNYFAAENSLFGFTENFLVTKTWDGGGTTENWSDAANWSDDSVPNSGDTVIFDGTSVRNAIIDIDFTVSAVQINSGYTGTIAQGAADLTVAGNFTQSSGTFTGGSGDINIAHSFLFSGGTFTASENTTSLEKLNATGGTFNHHNGTVVITGDSTDDFINISPTLNNLIFNKNNGSFSNFINGQLTVTGSLTLSDGIVLGGTIEARGAVNFGTNFDGNGNSSASNLLVTAGDGAARTINLDAGLQLMRITLNAPNVTINTTNNSGAGTLNWQILNLQAGAVNQGSNVNFVFNTPGANSPFTQSGGTFNGSAAIMTFGSAGVSFTLTGGDFNGGGGAIDIDGNFNFAGGTFKASGSTTYFGKQFSITGSATFNHNSGTVVWDGVSADNFINAPLTFNNFILNKNNNEFFTLFNGGLIVAGTLTLADGRYLFGNQIEARGDVSLGANFDGGDGALTFGGAANQTFTNGGGQNLNGIWTVNKSGGTVTLASDLDLSGGTADLILTNGIMATGNFTVNAGLRNITRTNGYINGSLRRNFNANNVTKDFYVGTANAISPATVFVNSRSGTNAGLTIRVSQGTHPNLSLTALGRYWTVTEHETVIAGFVFAYRDPLDINAPEANYRVAKINESVQFLTEAQASINPAQNNFTVNPVTEFATWTLGEVPQLQISPTNAGVQVQGTQTFTASGGIAPYTFDLLTNNSGGSINPASGEYTAGTAANVQDTVRVTDSADSSANAVVSVTAGTARQLAFTVQPANAQANAAITPAVQVTIRDQFGNPVTNSTDAVTIAIGDNPAGGTLSGTLTRNAGGGVAAFNDLSIDNSGNGYTLTATSGFLTTATSSLFNIASPFIVTNKNAGGAGSLRQAITNANNTPGTQTISFNIPGTPPFVINDSSLPIIHQPLIIDGTTQPGFAVTPIIELRGSPGASGLKINGGGSTIKGLAINRFGGSAINIFSAGGNVIQGNYLGTDASGAAALPNGTGIFIQSGSTDNLIGGATPGERNLISGNNFAGMVIIGANNTVRGNFIGTNAAGTAALGNQKEGIRLSANNTITENIVSGNGAAGISALGSDVTNVLIQGNLIGLDVFGINPLGNAAQGVLVSFNITRGVRLTGNRIFGNGKLGIQLINSGSTSSPLLNDPQDPDLGANNLQNYPVLASAITLNGTTRVSGSLNSTPNSTFRLEFFSSRSCGASGNGEGETFVGATDITTDAGGIARLPSLGFILPAPVADGRFITATATDAGGNTSEFSRCRIVSQLYEISGRVTANGQPLPNVPVRLTNPTGPTFSYTTATNSTGNYTFTFLRPADHTLTVISPEYSFTPPSRFYPNLGANQTNQDFTGVQQAYSVSGRVTTAAFVPNAAASQTGGNNFMPPAPTGPFSLRDVTFTISGTVNRTGLPNDFYGNYSFGSLPPGNYTLTPSKPNYTFTPPSASFTIVNSNQTIDFSGESLGLTTLTGRIVYQSSGGSINAMNANGSGLVTLASGSTRTFRFSSPSLAPGGSRVVYAREGSTFSTQIVTADFDGSDQAVILTDFNGLFAPSWSPDGTQIAFHDGQERLFFMNPDGSNVTPVTNCSDADWSPDGTKIVCLKHEGSTTFLRVFNLTNGNTTTLDTSPGAKFSPRWSPDGTRIAFLKGSGGLATSLVVLTGILPGDPVTTILSGSNVLYQTLAWSPDGARLALIRNAGAGLSDSALPLIVRKQLVTVQADGQAMLVIEDNFDGTKIDWGAANSIPTPTGSNVSIQTGAVSITASGVTGAGVTTITPITPGSAGTVPDGFSFGNMAYEISTTANFTPPVTICFVVSPPPAHGIPSIFHNENGTLVNITTSYNSTTNTVCGQTSSFSPFVIAEQIAPNFPSIGGLVIDSNGNPLSGVEVNLTGTENALTMTDSNGAFRFVNLTPGGNYNVQPHEVGYLFTEYNQDFVNLTGGENTIVFTGAATNFQISGRVVNGSGSGASGVNVTLDGAAQSFAVTDADGNYSFTDLPADGSFTIKPSGGTNAFSPAQLSLSFLASDLTGVDFTQLAPTAANVEISGFVVDFNNTAIAQAHVSITDSSGAVRAVRTNSFGYYHFENIAAGHTYVVSVSRRDHQFSPQVVSITDSISELNFRAFP